MTLLDGIAILAAAVLVVAIYYTGRRLAGYFIAWTLIVSGVAVVAALLRDMLSADCNRGRQRMSDFMILLCGMTTAFVIGELNLRGECD